MYNAYNPYTMSNALANYWATSGATVDPRALSDRNLFTQGDKLMQKLGSGSVGPNLALSDYVDWDRRVDDGDDGYSDYYSWSRKTPTSTPTSLQVNDGDWLNQQYNDLLDRDIEYGGLDYWTNALNQGQTRDQVRANIMRHA